MHYMNPRINAPESLPAWVTRIANSRYRRLKKTIRARILWKCPTLSRALIHRALREAEETAESTGFPHLVFPVLAEENVHRLYQFLNAETTSDASRYDAAAA